jgi:hypothetical protein
MPIRHHFFFCFFHKVAVGIVKSSQGLPTTRDLRIMARLKCILAQLCRVDDSCRSVGIYTCLIKVGSCVWYDYVYVLEALPRVSAYANSFGDKSRKLDTRSSYTPKRFHILCYGCRYCEKKHSGAPSSPSSRRCLLSFKARPTKWR